MVGYGHITDSKTIHALSTIILWGVSEDSALQSTTIKNEIQASCYCTISCLDQEGGRILLVFQEH